MLTCGKGTHAWRGRCDLQYCALPPSGLHNNESPDNYNVHTWEGQLIDHASGGQWVGLQEHCGRLGFDGHGNANGTQTAMKEFAKDRWNNCNLIWFVTLWSPLRFWVVVTIPLINTLCANYPMYKQKKLWLQTSLPIKSSQTLAYSNIKIWKIENFFNQHNGLS